MIVLRTNFSFKGIQERNVCASVCSGDGMIKIDWSVVFDMNKNKHIVTVDRPDGNRNRVRNIEA